MADFKRTFSTPHGIQDAQSPLKGKNGEYNYSTEGNWLTCAICHSLGGDGGMESSRAGVAQRVLAVRLLNAPVKAGGDDELHIDGVDFSARRSLTFRLFLLPLQWRPTWQKF